MIKYKTITIFINIKNTKFQNDKTYKNTALDSAKYWEKKDMVVENYLGLVASTLHPYTHSIKVIQKKHQNIQYQRILFY